jgi:heme exporter protein A
LSDTENSSANSLSSSILILKDIAFQRNEELLFSNINMAIGSGEILQIQGPNGSGKTTLLRMLSMTLSPTLGEILWEGKNVNDVREQYLGDLLFLGHQSGLKKSLSADENLLWWRKLNKDNLLPNSDALECVGLTRDKSVPCYHLSAGQLRRASLAKLYVARAKLWILDEPFSAIDEQFANELKMLLENHLDNGGVVILTTHQDLEIKGMKYISLTSPHKSQ